MSDAKHTPGPWGVYEGDPTIIVTADGTSLGEMTSGAPDIGMAEDIANARLAAAAPALLAELKCLSRAYVSLMEAGRDRIVLLGGECDPVDKMEGDDPNLRSARAAIANASGAA
jgi:hypothetical protein